MCVRLVTQVCMFLCVAMMGPCVHQVKDFMLAQPEVTKFRWKDTDYFPEKKKASKKKGSKKASTKKGSKKAKKEEEKSEL